MTQSARLIYSEMWLQRASATSASTAVHFLQSSKQLIAVPQKYLRTFVMMANELQMTLSN